MLAYLRQPLKNANVSIICTREDMSGISWVSFRLSCIAKFRSLRQHRGFAMQQQLARRPSLGRGSLVPKTIQLEARLMAFLSSRRSSHADNFLMVAHALFHHSVEAFSLHSAARHCAPYISLEAVAIAHEIVGGVLIQRIAGVRLEEEEL